MPQSPKPPDLDAQGQAVGSGVDETAFKKWYADASKRYNLNPDPDAPDQFYDYRAAFKAGAKPDETNHWPSDFKKPGHPNEVVGGFNTRTGERVPGAPRAKDAAELVRLGWDANTAKKLAATPERPGRPPDLDASGKPIVSRGTTPPTPARGNTTLMSLDPEMAFADIAAPVVEAGPRQMGEGVRELREGRLAKGASDLVRGAGTTAAVVGAPLLVPAIAAAPGAAAISAGAGYLGGKVLKGGARVLGASDDQAELAETVGNIAGGVTGPRVVPAAGRGVVQAATAVKSAPVATRRYVVSTMEDLVRLGVTKTVAKMALKLVKSSPDVAKGMSQAGGRLVPKSAPTSLEDELVSAFKAGEPVSSVTLPPHVPRPATGTTTRVYEAAPVTAAAPSAVAPPPPPPAPVAAPGAASKAMSQQRIAIGLAAKRANAEFNAEQYAAATDLVGQGLTPVEAVLKIKAAAKSPNAAADLARMLGLPTDAEMQAQIASRQYKR